MRIYGGCCRYIHIAINRLLQNAKIPIILGWVVMVVVGIAVDGETRKGVALSRDKKGGVKHDRERHGDGG